MAETQKPAKQSGARRSLAARLGRPEPEASQAEEQSSISLVVSDDLKRTRLTVLFRYFRYLPLAVWFLAWSVAVLGVVLAAWVAGIVTGRVPQRLHDFVARYARYQLRASSYLFLAADPFPGFTSASTYPVDLEVSPPVRQRRWTIALRPILAIPAYLLSALFLVLILLVAIPAWFVSLALGRTIAPFRDQTLFCLAYQMQTLGYVLLLTERYPGLADEIRSSTAPEGAITLPKLFELGVNRVRQGELGQLPVIVGLVFIALFFGSRSNWLFVSARNVSFLSLQIAATGAVAIGIVMVLLLGEIDLSVGSVAGLTSAVLGTQIVYHNRSWWVALIFALAVGALIGAFQGGWFALVGVPSFVVTLAGLLAWNGVQLRVLGSNGTVNVFESHIDKIAGSYLPVFWGWILGIGVTVLYALANLWRQLQRRRAGLSAQAPVVIVAWTFVVAALALGYVAFMNKHAVGYTAGVPTAAVILISLVIFFAWLTTHTKFGRYIYAVGGNAEAARRAGINVSAIRIVVFALSGTMAAMGGIILTSRLTAASTQTGAGNFLLEAIAAAVIGGVSLFGGRGSVWGALTGALVIGSVSNGLDLLGYAAETKYIVEGAILLLAVTVDSLSRRRRGAAGVA
jgi:D-xylose transport system permease protein